MYIMQTMKPQLLSMESEVEKFGRNEYAKVEGVNYRKILDTVGNMVIDYTDTHLTALVA